MVFKDNVAAGSGDETLAAALLIAERLTLERIEAFLHDEPLQKLVASTWRIEALIKQTDADETRAELSTVLARISQSIDDLRMAMTSLTEIDEDALEPAIARWLKAGWPDAEARVRSSLPDQTQGSLRRLIYRLVQASIPRRSSLKTILCEVAVGDALVTADIKLVGDIDADESSRVRVGLEQILAACGGRVGFESTAHGITIHLGIPAAIAEAP